MVVAIVEAVATLWNVPVVTSISDELLAPAYSVPEKESVPLALIVNELILNAIMTWWAVSLALLNHNFGNEVLSRDELLRYVPIFVAVLVWLTRILFIGSLSMAGEKLLGQRDEVMKQTQQPVTRPQPTAPQPRPAQPARPITVNQPVRPPARPQRPTVPNIPFTDDVPDFLRQTRPIMPVAVEAEEEWPAPEPELVRPTRPQASQQNRVRQQPPPTSRVGLNPAALQAKSRR